MADTIKLSVALDQDLLQRAGNIAAKTGTTVHALLNVELRHLVETFEAADAAKNQNFSTLLDFSLGRIDGKRVMELLEIDSDEDLLLLMTHARLPMPRLPEEDTRQMVELLRASLP